MKVLLTIFNVLAVSMLGGLMAQGEAEVPVAATTSNILDDTYNNILVILAVLVLIGVLLAGLSLIWALIETQKLKLVDKYGPEVLEKSNLASSSIWDKINQKSWNLVPMDKEQDIDLGHDYDGIRELDNSLPPWWVYMFYFTILWGVGYVYYYHISDKGMSQEQEYVAAIEEGEAVKAKFLATQADAIDEKTVTVLTNEKDIAEGKEIFTANCVVCHGAAGEGLVGPNFTDKYWLHGGSINDIFSTIKYGVPEKGMISWKAQLRPAAIQKVASYILTFQGTNPPNQKDAQGTLYEPTAAGTTKEAVAPQDTTSTK